MFSPTIGLLNKFAFYIKEQKDGSVLVDLPLPDKEKYKLVLSREFIEWFRGFTDAEGTFGFRVNSGTAGYKFKYQISLHHDDIKVLHYIKDTLGIGSVYENRGGNSGFLQRSFSKCN